MEFALKNRVILIYASNRITVDISLAGIPFEQMMIQRAAPFQFAAGCSLTTCSAEDLVIQKAFANRTKDWFDIEGIILRQGQSLDINYILEYLEPLCMIKEAPEILDRLHKLIHIMEY